MITSRDKRTFTRGACWILAEEISHVTGWEIREFEGDVRAHAFVRIPDGRYMDIEGIHTGREMLDRWERGSNFQFRSYKRRMWEIPWGWGYNESYYRNRARKIIPELLAKLSSAGFQ
jgi:hypothetical protein